MRLAKIVPAGHTDGHRNGILTPSSPLCQQQAQREQPESRVITAGRGGAIWVMAHLRVLDCMISHKWSRICDLYCAFNSQVCAGFIAACVHEARFSGHVFWKCTVKSHWWCSIWNEEFCNVYLPHGNGASVNNKQKNHAGVLFYKALRIISDVCVLIFFFW